MSWWQRWTGDIFFDYPEGVLLDSCVLTSVRDRIHGVRQLGDNFSTLTAPLVIVLTFGQTLGSLLDLQCPWPKLLREWMQFLDMFNINLELARQARKVVVAQSEA